MKQVAAWLRMVADGGDYPFPTSEASYNANLDKIDLVFPTNGGKLQADGSWLQESWAIDPDWPQSVPEIAAANGHTYIPSVFGSTSTGILTVLDSPSLQATAASNLVTLATSGRFDSPWDGVMFDLEQIPSSYQSKLSTFYTSLCEAVRSEGLLAGIWSRGRTGDSGPDYDEAYTNDFTVLGQVGDFVDMGCYSYWKPIPRSAGPYWWQRACIDYALSKGIQPRRLRLGCGLYSGYWEVEDGGGGYGTTHAKALELADGFSIDWIESNVNGVVREYYADLGAGCVWLHDDETLPHRLDLVDEYGLAGAHLFILGAEDDGVWRTIADWKRPAPREQRPTDRFYQAPNWCG